MKPVIFIVEDDKQLQNALSVYLKREGYDVVQAYDGLTAVSLFDGNTMSLVLLDIMIPGIDGWEVCKRIRKESDIPVIMLTARSMEYDKIEGFDSGADDYVTKPFSLKELAARIKAVLKRTGKEKNVEKEFLETGIFKIDIASRQAYVNGDEVVLTRKEFDVLHFFMKHPNQVFTRDQLLDNIWQEQYVNDYRTVDTHIKQLREKIDPSKKFFKTVWGVGYKYQENGE